jgi:multicomponent Na+:H+ antiporter subunit D
MVGAASISAFPLFSGFVSKSMVMDAAAKGHMRIIWFILLFASAGVFHHAGIKIPFFAFFGHDSGMRPKEAPPNMLIAMGITAFLCIFIGSFPRPLYSLLPYPVDYVPYTAPHVVGQTQLLFFSALAFSLLLLSGIYPGEQRCVNIDVDWVYRKGGRLFYYIMDKFFNGLNRASDRVFVGGLAGYLGRISRDGPTRAALMALVPVWLIGGAAGDKLVHKKAGLRAALRTGTSPVGISAAAATIFLIIVFLLM